MNYELTEIPKRTSRVVGFGLVVALLLALFAPLSASAMKPAAASAAKPGDQTIAELAVGNGSFTTLVAALQCTGLVGAVSGERQLTVFAPTDAAFAELGLNAGNVCSQPGLANILLYHVMAGRHTSTSVLARDSYRMFNGDRLTKAELAIAAPNLSASNGIVHVVNKVLLP